jgi:peptide deformylase
MILKVETGTDNPILRKKSLPVSKFDKKLKKFLKDMTETMIKKDGVGLAAPQVGVNERIVVINFRIAKSKWQTIPLFNPEILDASLATKCEDEGCLSLPGVVGKVDRFEKVIAKFLDEKGEKQVLELKGLNARVIQHEIDHLDGILFIDKATKIREDK